MFLFGRIEKSIKLNGKNSSNRCDTFFFFLFYNAEPISLIYKALFFCYKWPTVEMWEKKSLHSALCALRSGFSVDKLVKIKIKQEKLIVYFVFAIRKMFFSSHFTVFDAEKTHA